MSSRHVMSLVVAAVLLLFLATLNLWGLQYGSWRAAKQALARQESQAAVWHIGQCLRRASSWSPWTAACERLAAAHVTDTRRDYLAAAKPARQHYLWQVRTEPSVWPRRAAGWLAHLGFAGFLGLVSWRLAAKQGGRAAQPRRRWLALTFCMTLLWWLGGWLA